MRLTADLQRSRERLVTAREEERRRLRRDLHDGLGPQLASLTLTLDAARELLRHDVDAADMLLQELSAHTQAAIADIRRVVYDLRPPALDDLGLVLALREQAANYSQAGLQITIDAPDHHAATAGGGRGGGLPHRAGSADQRGAPRPGAHLRGVACRSAMRSMWRSGTTGVGLPADGRAGVGLTSMRERTAELGGPGGLNRARPRYLYSGAAATSKRRAQSAKRRAMRQ